MISWRYNGYVLLALLSAAVATFVALYVWQRRKAPGARYVTLMMVAVTVWSLGLMVEIGARNLWTLWVGLRGGSLGYFPLSLLWLLFALHYVGRTTWLRPYWVLLLALIPALSVATVWVPALRPLFYADVWLETSTHPWTLGWRPGPMYGVFVVYAYMLFLIGSFLLISWSLSRARLYRSQVISLLVAGTVPWLTSFLYLVEVFPPTLPAGPVAYTFSGLALAWGAYAFRLMDIVPVARDTLVERMRDGVVVVDAQYRLVELNEAALRVFTGGSPCVGMPASEILPEQLIEVLTPLIDETSRIIALPDAETERWYDVQVSALPARESQERGWVLLFHDVTDLHQARQDAEIADTTKSQFVSNVSHELRSPLTSIKLYIELLRRDEGANRTRYITSLAAEASRLQALIDDLLYVSRLDLGQVRCDPRPLDVNALIGELVRDRSLLFEERGLALAFEPQPVPQVSADPRLLQQVLTNLLTNALNYTPKGGVVLRTSTSTVNEVDWVTVAVRDTGLGIAEDEMAHLFARFHRGTSSERAQVPGTGLGLAISQEIAQLHGGHITCESQVGAGSVFTLWLPPL